MKAPDQPIRGLFLCFLLQPTSGSLFRFCAPRYEVDIVPYGGIRTVMRQTPYFCHRKMSDFLRRGGCPHPPTGCTCKYANPMWKRTIYDFTWGYLFSFCLPWDDVGNVPYGIIRTAIRQTSHFCHRKMFDFLRRGGCPHPPTGRTSKYRKPNVESAFSFHIKFSVFVTTPLLQNSICILILLN